MKKIKQAIAVLIAVALLIEPCIAAGSVKEVQAAETTTNVYEQMKVTDISVSPETEGVSKDAIELTGESEELNVSVAVDVPEGWGVSEIEIGWYAVNDDDYYDTVKAKYDISAQPDDYVYSLEYELHKYMKADIYYLNEVYVTYTQLDNTSNHYWLYGEATDWYKVASATNPVQFGWSIENDDIYKNVGTTDYTGTADYTIVSNAEEDSVVPQIKKIELNTTGTLNSSAPTEIKLTFNEEKSGISYISAYGWSADEEGYDHFTFEADGAEKYVGTDTIVLSSSYVSWRVSGKYTLQYVYIEDYAGNYLEYYLDDDEKYLEAEDYAKNEDGSYDEMTYKVKTVKYNVCDGHVYKNSVTKATTSANGSIVKKCKYCDAVKTGSKTIINKIKTVKLSKTTYTYDGKVKKPTVTVYDSKGNKIAASNYTVTYPSGRKNVGQYKVKIVFKNNYKGTVYKTFTIKPKATSISSISRGTKKFTVKWKKQSTQTTGYQIRYSTSSSFKSYNTKTISSNKTTSATVKSLKAGKKYYVKVRTYKKVKVNGEYTKIYSAWSSVKTVTTK